MLSNVGIYLTIRYKYLFNLSIQIKVDSNFYLKQFNLNKFLTIKQTIKTNSSHHDIDLTNIKIF